MLAVHDGACSFTRAGCSVGLADWPGWEEDSVLSCRLACLPELILHVPALFQVCREGQVLDAHQAAILRVFGIKMATFKLRLLAAWHAEGVHYLF